MATFSYIPSFEATELSKPRIRRTSFGDGYEHRLAFGLNVDPKEWQLQFSNRTDTERENIVTFLQTNKGLSFDWTPPRGSAGKFVCEEWQVTLSNCNNNQIRATFRQVFEA